MVTMAAIEVIYCFCLFKLKAFCHFDEPEKHWMSLFSCDVTRSPVSLCVSVCVFYNDILSSVLPFISEQSVFIRVTSEFKQPFNQSQTVKLLHILFKNCIK